MIATIITIDTKDMVIFPFMDNNHIYIYIYVPPSRFGIHWVTIAGFCEHVKLDSFLTSCCCSDVLYVLEHSYTGLYAHDSWYLMI